MNEFIRLVREMRNAQKSFFIERTQSNPIAAKNAEKKVDRWLKDNAEQKALAQALQLFPMDEGA